MKTVDKIRLNAFDRTKSVLLDSYDAIVNKKPFPNPEITVATLASAGEVSGSIAINNRCNYDCSYCYISELERNGKLSWFRKSPNSFSVERAVAIAREGFTTWGLLTIPAMEPFLSKDSREAVSQVAALNSQFVLKRRLGVVSNLANASKLSYVQIENIKKGVTDISFSLDSHNQEINDAGRGYGTYKRTLEGLMFLLDNQVNPSKFTIQAVIYRAMGMRIDEQVGGLVELANHYGIKRISLSACISSERYKKTVDEYETIYSDFLQSLVRLDRKNYSGVKVVAYTTYESPQEMIALIRNASKIISVDDLELNPYELSLYAPVPNLENIGGIVEFALINVEAGCYARFTAKTGNPLKFKDGFIADLGTSISECFDYQRDGDNGKSVGSWIPGLISFANKKLMLESNELVDKVSAGSVLLPPEELTSVGYMNQIVEQKVKRMLERNSALKQVYDSI